MSAPCPVAVPAPLRLQGFWIATEAEFHRLGPEWSALFERTEQDNVFLSFEWMSTWWKHFAKGQLAVIAIRDQAGRLVGVAPFYVVRCLPAMGARRLGFLSDDHVGSDHLNILTDPHYVDLVVNEVAQALFDHHGSWDYMELCDASDSSFASAFIAQLVNRGMQASSTTRRVCYQIPLPATFDAFLAGLGTSLRCNYRRRWKLLQRDHQGTCLAVSDPAEIERHFPTLIALHRMRFDQRSQESAFLAPRVPQFHVDAMRALAARGLVRLYLLQAGGETVSAIYGFAAGKTFQFYQCGMHPEWMRQGVGQVLIGNAIEQTIAAGYSVFDFLRGDESYKTQWTDRSREMVTWQLFDGRPASVLARKGLEANAWLRGVARNLKARLLARRASGSGQH